MIPPMIVLKLGTSLITNHTQIGPKMTSNKKKRLTSAAVMNLGAIVTRTNGIATHINPIKGTIIISELFSMKSSTKKNAKIATHNFPMTADGTKSLFFAYLARLAFIANPKAVMKPKKSPIKFPN